MTNYKIENNIGNAKTRNRYNIDNTNNIGNMGHLTKEQFT